MRQRLKDINIGLPTTVRENVMLQRVILFYEDTTFYIGSTSTADSPGLQIEDSTTRFTFEGLLFVDMLCSEDIKQMLAYEETVLAVVRFSN